MSYYASGYAPVVTQILAADYAGSDIALCDKIKDALVAGGWTLQGPQCGRCTLDFTGLPANGQYVRPLTSTEYWYFRTVIDNGVAREVLIGADAKACRDNLYNAIMDTGVGKGTTYSTATTASTEVVAAIDNLELPATPYSLWLAPMRTDPYVKYTGTENLANAVFANSTSGYDMRGWHLKSAKTPAGNQMQVSVHAYSYNSAYFGVYGLDEMFATISGYRTSIRRMDRNHGFRGGIAGRLTSVAGYVFVVKATPYWFTVHVHNDATNYSSLLVMLPRVEPGYAPLTVSAATNGTPIQITTTEPHGWENGDAASIEFAEGNTAANGDWLITRIDDYNFTLDGSVGNGTYTSGGLAGGVDKIARIAFGCGEGHLRTSNLYITSGASSLNQYAFSTQNFGSGNAGIGEFPYGATTRQFWGARDMIVVPELYLPDGSSTGSEKRWVGHFWDSWIVNRAHTRDIACAANSKNWKCFGSYADGSSLWIMEE